ncbi:unnamed protein product [Echinostoma caproni]|uniref:Fibronectin type-III domain-containing protein n=1 Tax=Echinostoma caproni TaxID=27848 RepID=A0A183ADL9_9TREM|nr:unnamed protein product [Echinostoma caproni]
MGNLSFTVDLEFTNSVDGDRLHPSTPKYTQHRAVEDNPALSVSLNLALDSTTIMSNSCFSSAAQGAPIEPSPFQVTRPLGLPAQLADRRTIRLDYGPAHITSIQFEPLYSANPSRLCFPQSPGRSMHAAGLGGRRLLVSHMYAPVFLFDLNKEELPDACDPQIGNSMECWLERQRVQRQSGQAADPEGTASSDEEEVSEPPDTRLTSDNSNDTRSGQPGEEEQPSLSSPFEMLSEYVAKVLASAPRARQIMAYRGRRSCRTVIKEAVFWGRDFIMSGSECGHVIVWNLIACSGIDCSVKIIEPDPSSFEMNTDSDDAFSEIVKEHGIKASTVCDINANHMRISLRAGSYFLERLARIRTGQAGSEELTDVVEVDPPIIYPHGISLKWSINRPPPVKWITVASLDNEDRLRIYHLPPDAPEGHNIYWKDPPSQKNVRNYVIQGETADSETYTQRESYPYNWTTLTEFPKTRNYTVRMRAENSCGLSAPSNAVELEKIELIKKPISLVVEPSDTTIFLAFTPDPTDYMQPQSFRVEYVMKDGTVKKLSLNGDETSVVLTEGLTECFDHVIRIYAVGPAGDSEPLEVVASLQTMSTFLLDVI